MKISINNYILRFLILVFSLCCLLPIVLVVSISITSEGALAQYGYHLIPKEISFYAYSYVIKDLSVISKAYLITLFITIVGTVLSLLINVHMAYPLSRKTFKFRKFFSFYIFFTMLFNGGLVSFYIVCTKFYGLKDSIWAMIVPMLFNAFFIILLRNFFSSIPDSIEESAKIDGAGPFRILYRIIVPLAVPGIATVGLFTSLNYWNEWFLGMLFVSNTDLQPLQLLLVRMMRSVEFLMKNRNALTARMSFPSESIRMVMCIITVGPIIFAYPFFQKYFIRGLTVGSIKA